LVKTFFLHIEDNSPLIKLHPVLKILLLIVINIEAWIIESPLILLIVLTVMILSFKPLKVPLSRIARFLLFAVMIVQAIAFSYLLGSTIPGNIVLLKLPWGTYVSDMTLLYAFTMILRFLTMLVGSTLILAVMRDVDITYGLISMKVPFSIAFTISLAFRMASIFLEDYFKVRDSMALRGTNFSSGSIFEKANKYSRLAVPLMVLGVRRMMELTYILEAKGLGLRKKRTYLYQFPLKASEKLAIVVLTSLMCLSIVAKVSSRLLSFPGWPFV